MPHMLCSPGGSGHLTICTDVIDCPGVHTTMSSVAVVDVRLSLFSRLSWRCLKLYTGRPQVNAVSDTWSECGLPYLIVKKNIIRSDNSIIWRIYGFDDAPKFHVYSHEFLGAVASLIVF